MRCLVPSLPPAISSDLCFMVSVVSPLSSICDSQVCILLEVLKNRCTLEYTDIVVGSREGSIPCTPLFPALFPTDISWIPFIPAHRWPTTFHPPTVSGNPQLPSSGRPTVYVTSLLGWTFLIPIYCYCRHPCPYIFISLYGYFCKVAFLEEELLGQRAYVL